MKEKYKIILKILLIFLLMLGALIFKFIPEYQASKGSSDIYIDIAKYQDIIEFKLNKRPNFALVMTKTKITNILFFDYESTCLYNQNIENTTISDGIKKIVEILIENNYLKQNDTIVMTKYKGNSYSETKQELEKNLAILNIKSEIVENKSTIEEKAASLKITGADTESLIKQIEIYSKDIARKKHNNVSTIISPSVEPEEITEDKIREYTDTVYKKIETYSRNNNIINQDITNMPLPITSIPANRQGTIFPNDTSWYYIRDGKVYAYISITTKNKTHSYCYQASIDEYKKGQC